MSIMTKKEIERLKTSPVFGSHNAYGSTEYIKIEKKDFDSLIETIEEAVEVIKSNRFQLGGHTGWDIAIGEEALERNTKTSLHLIREFLSRYKKED